MSPRTPTSTLTFVAGIVLVVAAAVVLAVGPAVEARRTALVFGIVAVVGAFRLPRLERILLAVVAVGGWGTTLVLVGAAPAVLIAHAGGAALVAVAALQTTRAREIAIADERGAAAAATTRTGLLSTVLRLQSLEPEAVLVAVVNGARDAGFASAVLRVPYADQLLLAAASPAFGETPPAAVGEDSVAGVAWRAGRPVVAGDRAGGGAAGGPGGAPPLLAAVAAPVLVDDEVAAVLVARVHEPEISTARRDAFDLLVAEAGVALGRARRFAADAATVNELRRLEGLTHDFVSTVSHELRTPMTVIAGLGNTLASRWDDLAAPQRADLLRRIEGNAERLSVMVRSLIDTSALERGQLVAAPSSVPLRPLVAGVVHRLATVLDGYEVAEDVPADLVVDADPGLLAHVLENLLTNVARHTPVGTRASVRARRSGDEVEVTVTDDGPGIAAVDLPHVLDRFYRAGEVTTRSAGGLGLGLALSQQILEAHGRELELRSREGAGTVFTFRLPAAAHADRG